VRLFFRDKLFPQQIQLDILCRLLIRRHLHTISLAYRRQQPTDIKSKGDWMMKELRERMSAERNQTEHAKELPERSRQSYQVFQQITGRID